MVVWYTLRPFGTFELVSVYFFGMLYKEKAGNPGDHCQNSPMHFKGTYICT
jgi:hypothetical protein